MSSRATRFALLAAALAVAALAYWLLRQPGPAAPSGDAAITETASSRTSSAPVSASGGDAARETAAAGASAAAATAAAAAPLPESVVRALSGITGRVVEPEGAPVKGASVELLGGILDFFTFDAGQFLFDPDSFNPRFEQQKVTTSADGRFRFERVDPRLYYLLGVNLGRGRPTIRFVDRTPNPGEHVDLGDVKLDPMLTLRGRVVDEAGRPIAGARVRASALPALVFQSGFGEVGPGLGVFVLKDLPRGPMLWSAPRWIDPLFEKLPFPSATSGPDGTFAISGAPSGSITLVVDGKDLPPSQRGPIPASKSSEKDVGDVVASRGEEAEIQVVDESGARVAGAEVRIGIPVPLARDQIALARRPITAGADGVAIAKGITGSEIAVAARAPDVSDWTIEAKAELVGDPIVVRVPAARSAIVRVSDADGKPLAARVAVQRAGFEPGDYVPFLQTPLRVRVASVDPGVYRVSGLKAGKFHVYARADGFEIGRDEIEVDGLTEPEISLQLRPEHRVRVLVLGKERGQSAPLEGANVFGAGEDAMENQGLRALGSSTTDSKGVALVRALGTGKYVIVATHPGYAAAHHKVELPDATEATLQLLVGGTIEGRAHRNGEPPATPLMVAIAPEAGSDDVSQMPRLTVTSLDGRFRVTNLAPGEYNVTAVRRFFDTAIDHLSADWMDLVEAFSSDTAKTKVVVRDEETSQADLDLATGGRARSGEDGRIRGVVTLNGEPLAKATVAVFGQEFKRARTDEHGRYDLGPMKPGQYSVSVQEPGSSMGMLDARNVDLKPSQELDVDFHVQVAGPIRGVVRAAGSRKPIAGAQIQASKKGDIDEAMALSAKVAVTGPDGTFEIDSTPVGPWSVKASAPSYASRAVTVHVGAGAPPPAVEIELTPGVHVRGRVEIDAPAKFAWAGVTFSPIGEEGADDDTSEVNTETRRFEIDSLSPGKYRCTLHVFTGAAVPEGSGVEITIANPGENPEFEPIDVDVPAGGLDNAVLKFKPAAKPATPDKSEKKDG